MTYVLYKFETSKIKNELKIENNNKFIQKIYIVRICTQNSTCVYSFINSAQVDHMYNEGLKK